MKANPLEEIVIKSSPPVTSDAQRLLLFVRDPIHGNLALDSQVDPLHLLAAIANAIDANAFGDR
jgi:hypothetical protein